MMLMAYLSYILAEVRIFPNFCGDSEGLFACQKDLWIIPNDGVHIVSCSYWIWVAFSLYFFVGL